MTCPRCGAQNNPGMPACYNCGSALAQSVVQPQQQWAPQQPAMQVAPAPPAQQQWTPQQPAVPAAPVPGGSYGGGNASSWDQEAPHSSHGHEGGGNIARVATISIVSLIVLGGGTLATLWAMGIIWSDGIVGEWTDDGGEKLEFKEDGTLQAEEFAEAGAVLEWEVNDDRMKWSISYLTFECNGGDEIPLEWVNDGSEDCGSGDDEGANQSYIDSRSALGIEVVMNMKFEIVEDVMFLKLVSMETELESPDDEIGDECIAFVRRDVADSRSEWQDSLDSVKIPSMCDGVEGYVGDDDSDSGTARYMFNLEDAYPNASNATDDHLAEITMSIGDDLMWSNIGIRISVDGGSMSECTDPTHGGSGNYYCTIYQHDSGDSWQRGGTVYIQEDNNDLCSSTCGLEVSIFNRMDGTILFTGYTPVN